MSSLSRCKLFSLVIFSILCDNTFGRITIELTPHDLTAPVEYQISNTFILAKSSVSTTSYFSSTPSSISINLTNSLDRIYTGQISIGTPHTQTFSVVFDTGSADLWVFSAQHSCNVDDICSDTTWALNECGVESVCCFFNNIMNAYDRNHSTTYSEYTSSSSSWSITYGKGDASGQLSKDSVTIGGLTASNQVFAEAVVWSNLLISCSEPMSGILGFAMKAASEEGANTLIESLYRQNQIESKLFSVSLKAHGQPSELIIGDPDPSKYNNDIIWGNVIQPKQTGMWFTQLTGILYTNAGNLTGYEWLDVCTDDAPCLALIDTGTSYITMPALQYHKLLVYLEDYVQQNGATCFINSYHNVQNFLCSTHAYAMDDDLPYLWFQIGGRAFRLAPSQYMLTGSSSCTGGGNSNSGLYDCLGISALDSMGANTYILGDIFLRQFYFVFDEDKYRVGIGSMEDVVVAIDRPAVTNLWIYVAVIFMIIGAIGVIVCIVLSCWKLHKPSNELWKRQRLITSQQDIEVKQEEPVVPRSTLNATNVVTIMDLNGDPNESDNEDDKDKVVNVLNVDCDVDAAMYQKL